MPRKVSAAQLQNRAVCVVVSWMDSWGIKTRLPEDHEEGDVVVEGKVVALREGAALNGADLVLSPTAILGSNLTVMLAELHRLTKFIGRGMPRGFRTVPAQGRARTEDYLGVSMRLTPFARAPNIPVEEYRKWLPTLKREADRAGRRCAGVLSNMGLDKSDMFAIGLVYLTNFLARHRVVGDDKTSGAYLSKQLKQHFGRWADVTIRHLKKNAPVTSGLPIDFLMGSPCPNSSIEDAHGTDKEASYTFNPEVLDHGAPPSKSKDPDFDDPEEQDRWMKRKAMKDGRYQAKRRRNAKAALESALSEMPHDRMVFVLREVRDSDFQHPDAREEAGRRLTAHVAACGSCHQ